LRDNGVVNVITAYILNNQIGCDEPWMKNVNLITH
jgi:hypothetical protein